MPSFRKLDINDNGDSHGDSNGQNGQTDHARQTEQQKLIAEGVERIKQERRSRAPEDQSERLAQLHSMTAEEKRVKKEALLQKRLQALQLRQAGFDYESIAQRLEYVNPSTAYHAVQSALKRLTVETAEGVLNMELSRLDRMLSVLWTRVLQGDYSAMDRVLKIMDRRANYLGLDAPKKVDITESVRRAAIDAGLDPDMAVEEAQRIVAQMEHGI